MLDLATLLKLKKYGVDPTLADTVDSQHLESSEPAPAPAAIAPEELIPEKHNPSFARRAWATMAAMGGADPATLRHIQDPDGPERAARQRLTLARRLFPGDAQAQLLYATGNQEFMNSVAKRYEDKTVGDDTDLVRNGQRVYRNPKSSTFQSGDQVASVEDGVTKWSGPRDASYKEKADARHDRATEGQEQQKIDLTGTKNDADIARDEEKTAVDSVVRKAAKFGLEALTPSETKIFETWETSQTRETPEEKVERLAKEMRLRARSAGSPPAAAAGGAKPKAKVGQTATGPGDDGHRHRWLFNGTVWVDKGVIP